MNNIDIVHYGSDMKMLISPDFGDVSADSVDFSITFFVGSVRLTLKKSQLIKVNDSDYIACIKAPDTCRGRMKATIRAEFPDKDFSDGTHVIVEEVDINIEVR